MSSILPKLTTPVCTHKLSQLPEQPRKHFILGQVKQRWFLLSLPNYGQGGFVCSWSSRCCACCVAAGVLVSFGHISSLQQWEQTLKKGVFLNNIRYRTASPVSGLQVRGQEARKATSHGDQDFVQQKTVGSLHKLRCPRCKHI